MKIIVAVLPLLVSSVALAADPLVLEDFDGGKHEHVNWTVAPEVADHDEDGENEGLAVVEGFKTIMKLSIPRAGALSFVEENPILSGSVSADRDVNPVKFLIVLPMVQTNVDGKDVYEPLVGQEYNILDKGPGRFAFDLREAQIKGGVTLRELVEKFEAGAGDFFQIGLIQQTSKGATSKVVYDDIELSAE